MSDLDMPVAKPPRKRRKLWITDNGDLVSEARVKRIRLAQDVINSAEESVYDTLWNAKLLQTDDRESCRIVQAGYDYLVKRSRLARKTIQRIIAKLLEKDFIVVESRADIYLRTSTIYRVYSYKAVLERHLKKGRLYVAKMGPGFSYVKPLDELSQRATKSTQKDRLDLTTVDRFDVNTIVETDVSTVVNETTVTMVKIDPTTVVKMSPYLLDTDVLDNTSSSAVRDALLSYGALDDDVTKQLIQTCRNYAPDCTVSEIVHFIHQKGAFILKRKGQIFNPAGFLATAVPKCFSGQELRSYREQRTKDRADELTRDSREQAALDEWRREQESSLQDPNVSEQEKHLIRLCLGLNTS